MRKQIKETYLITGVAGFIGFSLALNLLKKKKNIIGLDNLNNYYDIKLKKSRLEILSKFKNFKFIKTDLTNFIALNKIFKKNKFSHVFHLAAQAGVRYSLKAPEQYIKSNINGFYNILELSKLKKIKHFIYASSSSVYGANKNYPFSETSNCSHPIQLYAATKLSNEVMAHSYSSLYNLPTSGIRFFTVYGPWGRPDMALFLFVKAMLNNKPINVFNHGKMIRDFTYVDDIVNGICRTIDQPAESNKDWNAMDPDPSSSTAPYRLYNIGNNKPVPLMSYIKAIENALGKKASINFMPMQDGDVPSTCADITKLKNDLNYEPKVSVDLGVRNFVSWYREFYKVSIPHAKIY